MDMVRFSGFGEWSALYVDGRLDCVGDHYVVDERISELLGVVTEYADAFMQGGNTYDDVAPTLEEAYAYMQKQIRRSDEAETLRTQAEELLRAAREMEDQR